MIKQIVKNHKTHTFESSNDILEGLNYFRDISSYGLHNLSELELERLKKVFDNFFNISLMMHTDTHPTKLFRVTNNKNLYDGKKVKLQKITDLVGPPSNKSNIGRCNLKGESVFYASLNKHTALWETQPQIGDYITISEWKIKDGEKICTNSIFHPIKILNNKESQIVYNAYVASKDFIRKDLSKTFEEIFSFFSDEFMKSVNENQKSNYLFSACFASKLLQNIPNSNNLKIEAITYPSVKKELGVTNFAMLNSLVFKKLELVNITVLNVSETNYDLKDKTTKDFIKVSPLVLKIEEFDFEKDRIIYNSKEELRLAMDLINKDNYNKY